MASSNFAARLFLAKKREDLKFTKAERIQSYRFCRNTISLCRNRAKKVEKSVSVFMLRMKRLEQ